VSESESQSIGEEAVPQLQDRAAQARRPSDLLGRAPPQAAARLSPSVSAKVMESRKVALDLDRLNGGGSAAKLGALFGARPTNASRALTAAKANR